MTDDTDHAALEPPVVNRAKLRVRRTTDKVVYVTREALGTIGDAVRNLFLTAIILALAFIFGSGIFLIWTVML